MGQSLDCLSLDERLESYRISADQALREAARTHDPATRASLLALAAKWQSLASEIERVVRHLNATIRDAEGNPHSY